MEVKVVDEERELKVSIKSCIKKTIISPGYLKYVVIFKDRFKLNNNCGD